MNARCPVLTAGARDRGPLRRPLALPRQIEVRQPTLFDLVHGFCRRRPERLERDVLRRLITDIAQRALARFLAEEEVMEGAGHPTCEAHRAAHRRIIDDLVGLIQALAGDGKVAAGEVAHAMDALIVHHLSEDRVFEDRREVP